MRLDLFDDFPLFNAVEFLDIYFRHVFLWPKKTWKSLILVFGGLNPPKSYSLLMNLNII